MENKICPCCKIELKEYNAVGNYCPTCYSIFIKSIPSEKELSEYYENYLKSYHGGGRTKGADKRQIQYAKKYLKITEKYSTGKNIIDIGSANNPFPNFLSSKGYHVTIVDFSKPTDLLPEIKYIKSSLENIKSDKKYNVATAFAVLEHTRFPVKALENLVRLVDINGVIIIYIPEIGRFADKYSLGTTTWFCPPQHLNLLSKKGLASLMKEKNCKLIYYSRFELNPLRYFVRYNIGLIEGIVGFILKNINKKYWESIRKKRKSKFRGMDIFIFKRTL